MSKEKVWCLALLCIFSSFQIMIFFLLLQRGKKKDGAFMLFSLCSHWVLRYVYLKVHYQTDKVNISIIFLEVYGLADKYLMLAGSSVTLWSTIPHLSSAGWNQHQVINGHSLKHLDVDLWGTPSWEEEGLVYSSVNFRLLESNASSESECDYCNRYSYSRVTSKHIYVLWLVM